MILMHPFQLGIFCDSDKNKLNKADGLPCEKGNLVGELQEQE